MSFNISFSDLYFSGRILIELYSSYPTLTNKNNNSTNNSNDNNKNYNSNNSNAITSTTNNNNNNLHPPRNPKLRPDLHLGFAG